MRIWFDVLTPKQLLFFESMINRAKLKHEVLFTSRNYKEVMELIRIRGLHPILVGEHGGQGLSGKLGASLVRAKSLVDVVDEFQPDATVSFCSPEACMISFNLNIYNIAFSNAPHAEAACMLSIPLLDKLLIPNHIPKKYYAKYGLESSRIVQYNAMDEFLIVRNSPAMSWDEASIGLSKDKKTILFRTYETKAAYVKSHTDMWSILDSIIKNFSDCNIVVLARYSEQIKSLQNRYSDDVIILESAFDSGTILSKCDLLIGSGGTMTTEAVLRGVPAVSYEAIPNWDEKYLVNRGVLVRAKSPADIVKESFKVLSQDRELFAQRARQLLSAMEDPYDTLDAQLPKKL